MYSMERIPKHDFFFLDETGDPGNDFVRGGSVYFAVGCVHLTDLSLELLHKHFFAMGYFSDRFRELKSSRLSRVQKDHIEDIAKEFCDSTEVAITVIFVDKQRYAGPYFSQDGKRPYDSLYFRNFITRQLLEHHFQDRNLWTSDCDLIFDRAISEEAEDHLKRYLRGNFRLPNFANITHCDSRYVVALQFADAVVHIVKEYVFGKRESVDGRVLRCIKVVDVSDPRCPRRLVFH